MVSHFFKIKPVPKVLMQINILLLLNNRCFFRLDSWFIHKRRYFLSVCSIRYLFLLSRRFQLVTLLDEFEVNVVDQGGRACCDVEVVDYLEYFESLDNLKNDLKADRSLRDNDLGHVSFHFILFVEKNSKIISIKKL